MADPKGRVAIVTGAGRGIGLAIAKTLAQSGALVSLWARTASEVEAAAKLIEKSGGKARADVVDVCDRAKVREVLRRVEHGLGPVDILVNNAGIAPTSSLAKTTDEDWDRVMKLNLEAPFHLSRLVIPGMKERRYGRIVNVASTAGLRGYAYTLAYTTSKHGLLGMTRALSKECIEFGVTVNAVCPGFTETSLVERAALDVAGKTGRTAAEIKREFTKSSPLRRLVQPAEVARAVLLFVGPESAAISGQSLSISGGEVEVGS